MQGLTRRAVMLTGAVAVTALAMPATLLSATPLPIAEMLFTVDEPWGVFVRGHVSKQQFDAAGLSLLERDSEVRENAEDWFYQNSCNDDGELIAREITADAEHCYMRISDENDPDRRVPRHRGYVLSTILVRPQ